MRSQTRFVLAACGTARAEPDPLDGFFVDLALGVGYSSGSYNYGNGASGLNPPGV